MKKSFKFMVLATLASLVMLPSCKKDNPESSDPEALVLSTSSLKFETAGGEQTFTVLANATWTITAPTWATVNPTTGAGDKVNHTITVTVGEYTETANDRTGEIVVSLPKGKTAKVALTQTKKVGEPAEIKTADDLVNYINYFAEKATSATIKEIKNDIDMAGKSLNPLAAFKGTLKGNGYSIKNLVFHHPIVDTLYGTFDNIKIDATCSYVLDSTSVATIAPFSGFLMGTLSNCENKMNITATDPAFSGNTYVAGLTAKILDLNAEGCNHKIENCKNSGNLALVFTDSTKVNTALEYHVAGLAAICETGTVTGCTNSGEVKQQGIGTYSKHNKDVTVGGFSSKNTKCTWTNCINTGNVYNDKSGNKKVRTGGAIGFQDKVDDSSIPTLNILENCTIICTVSTAKIASDAGTKFDLPNRNDIASSGSMIVGRMSGQRDKKSILNFGVSGKSVKVAGKIKCIEPGLETEVTISASNVTKYVCGAGSATNYSPDDATPVTWQVWEAEYLAN